MRELRGLDRLTLVALAGCLAGLLAASAVTALHFPQMVFGYDFQAFWCGGHALLAHANPYLNEPLHTCERLSSPSYFKLFPNITIPSPLPGYALLLFVPFALLPYHIALALWSAVIVVSAVGVAWGIVRLTGMSLITALLVTVIPIVGTSLVPGALVPVPILLVVWAAGALRARQWTIATVLLGCAMIEPHMVLPACAAVFMSIPAMRWRLLLGGAVASVLCVATVGASVAWSYFTTTLPLQAAAEPANLGQDSLTAWLYQLHVPARVALTMGAFQYVTLAVVGVGLALALRRRFADAAWLALLPSAFAVMGGEYIHLCEVMMAVPLACMAVVYLPSWASRASLLLLAVAFESAAEWVLVAVACSLSFVWLTRRLTNRADHLVAPLGRVSVGLSVSVAFFMAAIAAHHYGVASFRVTDPLAALQPTPGNVSASIAWASFDALFGLPHVAWVWFLEKGATALPLGLLIGACVCGALHVVVPRPATSGSSAKAATAPSPTALGSRSP